MAAVALIAVLGFLWYLRTARNSPEPTSAMTVLPLTTFEGYKDFGSFSPDGKSIVFSWNGGREKFFHQNIYIKKIEDSAPVRLTFAQQDETHPVWSPDGQYIAFCQMIDARTPFQRFGIYIVPAAGGTPRKIAEDGEGVSWSPDGKTLALSGLPPDSGGIFLAALTTGKRTRLTRPEQYIDHYPVFSPDGQWIAFTRSVDWSASELFVVRSRGATPQQLTFDRRPIYGEAWTADGKEIVFSSNRAGGGESLWRIPVAGGAPRRVSATLWGAYYPAISPQGGRGLYTESYEDTNIYSSDGSGFAGQFAPERFGTPKLLIASSRRDDSPNIAPTDGRIAFVSTRSGDEEIWIYDGSGGQLRQLTAFRGPVTGTPRWSPDGRWIVFDSVAAGNPNIYLISPQGGTPRRLTNGPFGNYMPSWSPDGKRIYFKSDRSGSDQIWWIPADGGPATELTHGGAWEAFASPDGKLVYYTKRAWGAIWSVPADGGPERPVAELERFDRIYRSWGVVQQGIYFISKEEGPRQIVRFFSFATRQVYPLLTVEGTLIWNSPNVALSSDGRRLHIARLDHETNDLMMIENFR
jgi:Tol biopolymer transport system component